MDVNSKSNSNNDNNAMVVDMLEPELAELLAEFLTRLQGKNLKEILPILTKFKGRLPKDKVFSEAEKSAIVERALEQMPVEERAKCKTFLKMFRVI